MSWNYRILERGGILSMHEVYYSKAGKPHSWTMSPAAVVSDNLDEMRWQINKMRLALKKPILRVSRDGTKLREVR